MFVSSSFVDLPRRDAEGDKGIRSVGRGSMCRTPIFNIVPCSGYLGQLAVLVSGDRVFIRNSHLNTIFLITCSHIFLTFLNRQCFHGSW